MNAAERFLAASRARDVEGATEQLAPDVVMLNPATDDPVAGRDAVGAALRAVEAACDEFRHTHLLAEPTGEPLFALVFEASIGETAFSGVDLIELDESDRIGRFTVSLRPASALSVLGARMARPAPGS